MFEAGSAGWALAVPRTPIAKLTRPNQRWSMDFLTDALADGRKFRSLRLGDDLTRESPAIETDVLLPGERVVAVRERVGAERGFPEAIGCDNGPEFPSQALDQ